jgi:hypothetical protein
MSWWFLFIIYFLLINSKLTDDNFKDWIFSINDFIYLFTQLNISVHNIQHSLIYFTNFHFNLLIKLQTINN